MLPGSLVVNTSFTPPPRKKISLFHEPAMRAVRVNGQITEVK